MRLIQYWIQKLQEKKELSEDDTTLYLFLLRRMAYLLIEMKDYDVAEDLLKGLLKFKQRDTVEFAIQELEYLKKIRHMS